MWKVGERGGGELSRYPCYSLAAHLFASTAPPPPPLCLTHSGKRPGAETALEWKLWVETSTLSPSCTVPHPRLPKPPRLSIPLTTQEAPGSGAVGEASVLEREDGQLHLDEGYKRPRFAEDKTEP